MNYYIKEIINKHLSVRELEFKIKSNEYERLPEYTKNKLIKNENIKLEKEVNDTHYEVGKEIWKTIKKLGGTMPEYLPTPEIWITIVR